MRVSWILAVLTFAVGTVLRAAVVELATDVEFVPQSHAAESAFGAGLVAIALQLTDPEHIRPTFIAHSAEEFMRRYSRLPATTREHGIWITLAQRGEYSDEELRTLRQLEALCRHQKVPMFTRTGRDTDDWHQVSGNAQ